MPLAKQAADDLDRFGESGVQVVLSHSERLILFRRPAARTQSEYESAVTDHVDRLRDLGYGRRIAERRAQDSREQPDSRRHGSECRNNRRALPGAVRARRNVPSKVVDDTDRVEAGLLAQHPQIYDGRLRFNLIRWQSFAGEQGKPHIDETSCHDILLHSARHHHAASARRKKGTTAGTTCDVVYIIGSARLTKATTRTAAPKISHALEGLTYRRHYDIIMLSYKIGRQMDERNNHHPHVNFGRVDGDGLRVVPFNPVSPAEPNV